MDSSQINLGKDELTKDTTQSFVKSKYLTQRFERHYLAVEADARFTALRRSKAASWPLFPGLLIELFKNGKRLLSFQDEMNSSIHDKRSS